MEVSLNNVTYRVSFTDLDGTHYAMKKYISSKGFLSPMLNPTPTLYHGQTWALWIFLFPSHSSVPRTRDLDHIFESSFNSILIVLHEKIAVLPSFSREHFSSTFLWGVYFLLLVYFLEFVCVCTLNSCGVDEQACISLLSYLEIMYLLLWLMSEKLSVSQRWNLM